MINRLPDFLITGLMFLSAYQQFNESICQLVKQLKHSKETLDPCWSSDPAGFCTRGRSSWSRAGTSSRRLPTAARPAWALAALRRLTGFSWRTVGLWTRRVSTRWASPTSPCCCPAKGRSPRTRSVASTRTSTLAWWELSVWNIFYSYVQLLAVTRGSVVTNWFILLFDLKLL